MSEGSLDPAAPSALRATFPQQLNCSVTLIRFSELAAFQGAEPDRRMVQMLAFSRGKVPTESRSRWNGGGGSVTAKKFSTRSAERSRVFGHMAARSVRSVCPGASVRFRR
jgi:hypothetical protein